MSDSSENRTDSESPNNGSDPRNAIIIIAVVVILILLGALAYLVLADDSGEPVDPARPEQPIAPTTEPVPEQPIAPTPELQPEQPIAPTPEASLPFTLITIKVMSFAILAFALSGVLLT